MKHVHSGSGEIPWRPGEEDCGCGVSGASRREFLKSVAAVGAGALLPATSLPGLLAQVASPAARALSGRIDVHHHVYPAALLRALGGGGAGGQSTGRRPGSGRWTRAAFPGHELDRAGGRSFQQSCHGRPPHAGMQ